MRLTSRQFLARLRLLEHEVARRPAARAATLALLFAALALVYLYPLFKNVHNWGMQDWDVHLFYLEVPRVSLQRYSEIPLWNPFYVGGLPCLGHPLVRFPSPAFVLPLAFGTVIGAKLEIFVFYVIGLWGSYALGRNFDLQRSAAFVVACIYMLGGMFAVSVAYGMHTFLAGALLPWLFRSVRLGFENLRHVVVAAVLLAVMVFAGGIHLVLLAAPFFLVWTAAEVAFGRRQLGVRAAARTLLSTAVLAALLAGVKLVPMLELMHRLPVLRTDYSGYSLQSLTYSLLHAQEVVAPPPLPAEPGFIRGMSWGIDENNCYVGVTALILFAIGLFAARRTQFALVLSLVVAVYLSFGDRAPLSLWGILQSLPFFESMRVAQRFRWFWMLALALCAGIGLQAASNWLVYRHSRAASTWLTLAVMAGLAIELLPVGRVYGDATSIPPLEVKRHPEFHQIAGMPRYDQSGFIPNDAPADPSRAAWSSAYPAVLSGIGSIGGVGDPVLSGRGTPAEPIEAANYRGEVHVEGEGTARIVEWSPNRIAVDLAIQKPAWVVVNQNYFPGWKMNGERTANRGGLIAGYVTPIDRRVVFSYRPWSVTLGLLLSVFGCAAAAAVFVRAGRTRAEAENLP